MTCHRSWPVHRPPDPGPPPALWLGHCFGTAVSGGAGPSSPPPPHPPRALVACSYRQQLQASKDLPPLTETTRMWNKTYGLRVGEKPVLWPWPLPPTKREEGMLRHPGSLTLGTSSRSQGPASRLCCVCVCACARGGHKDCGGHKDWRVREVNRKREVFVQRKKAVEPSWGGNRTPGHVQAPRPGAGQEGSSGRGWPLGGGAAADLGQRQSSCHCAYVMEEVVGVRKWGQGPGIPERVKGQPASSCKGQRLGEGRVQSSCHSALRDPEQAAPGPSKGERLLGAKKAHAPGDDAPCDGRREPRAGPCPQLPVHTLGRPHAQRSNTSARPDRERFSSWRPFWACGLKWEARLSGPCPGPLTGPGRRAGPGEPGPPPAGP